MTPSEYDTIFQVENQHWWYTGMRQVTLALLRQHLPQQSGLDILDAGCGTGGMMPVLASFGRVTGCDLSPHALSFCRQRGLHLLGQSSVERLPFAAESFDLVTSFDVLYHVWVLDLQHALRECQRVLRPGGFLFLRLPAYDWLRSHHDEVIYTRQRFRAETVRRS